MTTVLDLLDTEEKRRYIAQHAPSILCALIGRRASSDPHYLIETAVSTAAQLFDEVMPPVRRNGNGRAAHSETLEV